MLLFFYPSLPPSLSDQALGIAGYTAEAVVHVPRNRTYKSLDAFTTIVLTAGSATVQVYKNGTTAGSLTLDTNAHRARKGLTLNVQAGDRVEVKVTTTSDLAPTTADLLALIQ